MPRQPEQVEEFLQLLRCALLCSPHTRIGQTLLNVCREHPGFPDIWEVKDDNLIGYLKEYLKAPGGEKTA